MAVVQVVLSDSLAAAQAEAMGLDGRDYLIGEQITVERRYADGLMRAGYLAPAGTPATSIWTGLTTDPTAPSVILGSGSTYPPRSSVTTNPSRVVLWIGTSAPPIGGGYAITGVDVWIQA